MICVRGFSIPDDRLSSDLTWWPAFVGNDIQADWNSVWLERAGVVEYPEFIDFLAEFKVGGSEIVHENLF